MVITKTLYYKAVLTWDLHFLSSLNGKRNGPCCNVAPDSVAPVVPCRMWRYPLTHRLRSNNEASYVTVCNAATMLCSLGHLNKKRKRRAERIEMPWGQSL